MVANSTGKHTYLTCFSVKDEGSPHGCIDSTSGLGWNCDGHILGV